jgi:hypothetical protein
MNFKKRWRLRLWGFVMGLGILGSFLPGAQTQSHKGFINQVVISKGEEVILYKESHALLIGVSKYKYWSSLENIPREMALLESALKNNGFHVQTHLDPTCIELKSTIENFINQFGFNSNNRLLIFFSGHGYTRQDGQKGYIVPADAVDPRDDEIGFAQKAIEMEQIITWAKRIESKHALFVFDSCFSGTIFRTKTTLVPAYISYLTGKPVRQFITAGSAGEKVPSESCFIKCLIRGIDGEADDDHDGYITGTELGLYLQKNIKEYKVGQSPQVGKIRDPELDQGDFVFINQVPPAPEPKDIDISILKEKAEKIKREREEKKRWVNWQEKFEQNVEKLKKIDKESDISPSSKKEKWQELLDAYNNDNPYTDEDERLRKYVKDQIQYWNEKDGFQPLKFQGIMKDIKRNAKGFWEGEINGHIMVYIPELKIFVDKYEVSFDQLERVKAFEKKRKESNVKLKNDSENNSPAVVDYEEAELYCKQKGFRLLTEREWEYIAGGIMGYIYSWGKEEVDADHIFRANYDDDFGVNDGYEELAPVNSFEKYASPFGVVNLSGNVWEWVDGKICKGGGFMSKKEDLKIKSSSRNEIIVGIRCALDVEK